MKKLIFLFYLIYHTFALAPSRTSYWSNTPIRIRRKMMMTKRPYHFSLAAATDERNSILDIESSSGNNDNTAEIQMPNFDGKIVQWFKKAGDRVSVGEPILSVESLTSMGRNGFRISTDINASKNGYLAARYKLEGEMVDARNVLAVIVPDQASLTSYDDQSVEVSPSQSSRGSSSSWWSTPYQPGRSDPFEAESTLGMEDSNQPTRISPDVTTVTNKDQSTIPSRAGPPRSRPQRNINDRQSSSPSPSSTYSDYGNSSSLPSRFLGSMRVSGGEAERFTRGQATFTTSDVLRNFEEDYTPFSSSSSSSYSSPTYYYSNNNEDSTSNYARQQQQQRRRQEEEEPQRRQSYKTNNQDSVNFSGEDFLAFLESRGVSDDRYDNKRSNKNSNIYGRKENGVPVRNQSIGQGSSSPRIRSTPASYDRRKSNIPPGPSYTRKRRKTLLISNDNHPRHQKRRKPNNYDVAASTLGGTIWGSSLGLGAMLAGPYLNPSVGSSLASMNNSVPPVILGLVLGSLGYAGGNSETEAGYSIRHVLGFGNGVKSNLYNFVNWTRNTVDEASKKALNFVSTGNSNTAPLRLHHITIKTRNIEDAIDFYSLFGFQVAAKFRIGQARASWLDNIVIGAGRIELIEVPPTMLQRNKGPVRALDRVEQQELLGLNHLTLDVTDFIRKDKLSSLSELLGYMNERSFQQFGKGLRLAVEPQKQTINDTIYECTFIYDPDGSLIELQYATGQMTREDWEPLGNQGIIDYWRQ